MTKISKEFDGFLHLSEKESATCGPMDNERDIEGGGGGGGQPLETITRIPDIDMYSTAYELTIEVEMPGVKKSDIDLYIHKNTIKLTALKAEAVEDKKTNYVCLERVFGRLYRSIDIPFPVNTSMVRAVFKNGVLSIVIPRVEDKRSAKRNVFIESK